jgi:hypothetical protein
VAGEQFYERHRVPISGGTGQVSVGGNGKATVVLSPEGLGTRWYPSQIQVSTSSGPTDTSSATAYKMAVHAVNVVGYTAQGGGDTFGLSIPAMTPGDLLIVEWENANSGDTATLVVYGDQEVLL